jgi:16S rRNA (guanine(1405)-N(7))-methyltransferase
MADKGSLNLLVAAVLKKSKYSTIDMGFIRRIGEQEIAKRSSFKEAVKSTCSKLHQVGGAFLENRPNFSQWLTELKTLPEDIHSPEIMQFCLEKMPAHASTNERLPILNDFFKHSLECLAPIHSLLDLGCGLNPLALPWIPLAKDPIYHGIDIFSDMIRFDQQFLQHVRLRGRTSCADILDTLPRQRFQMALALKILPLIDQIEKERTHDWLESIPADHLLVSFPIFSLSGKGKGMLENYSIRFSQMIEGGHWKMERFDFSSELAFLLHRQGT